MPKAVWNDTVIAESDETVMVEGNHYFPPSAIKREYLREVEKTTTCPWKGEASYYDVVVDGDVNSGAAWTYRDPKTKAGHIEDHVAFWGGVQVID